MTARTIDEAVLTGIFGEKDTLRMLTSLDAEYEGFQSVLNNSDSWYQRHHLVTIEDTLEVSRGKSRKTGGDVWGHYAAVALTGAPITRNLTTEEHALFNAGLGHDLIEDKIESAIQNELSAAIVRLQRHITQANDLQTRTEIGDDADNPQNQSDLFQGFVNRTNPDLLALQSSISKEEEMLRHAIVGYRTRFLDEFKERHLEFSKGVKKGRRKRFLKVLFGCQNILTRFRRIDDNYASYLLDIYSDVYSSVVKWRDNAHNGLTLWPVSHPFMNALDLETLARREQELIELQHQSTARYEDEKRKRGTTYSSLLTKPEFDPDWRLRNLEKALLHVNLGKEFLFTKRLHPFYQEVLKPAFVAMLKMAYVQAARERMFHAVYNPEITLEVMGEIESEWVEYMQHGLNIIEITDDLGGDSMFQSHFQGVIEDMMSGEMMRKILGDEKMPRSSVQMYVQALVYESTLQQHIRGFDLLTDYGIQTVDDLRAMRTPEHYHATSTSQDIRMNYHLESIGLLFEHIREIDNR